MAAGKKNAARLGAHIVFVDESGFLLMPNVLKTWAPRGQTPIHRHHYRRDKVSVISGISVSPERHRLGLYYQLWLNNIGHAEVCVFLRHLLRYLRGHVIVLLDNSSTHKGEPLRELCSRHSRLHLEYFPPYAPLGPRVWELRENLTAYDAWYVALAEELGLPLATLDGRLSRAPGPRCEFTIPTRLA